MGKLSTELKLEQKQGLTAVQIQGIQLLTLQSLQMEQRIEREVEENPALEKVDDDNEEKDTTLDDYLKSEDNSMSYKTGIPNSRSDDPHALMLSRLSSDNATLSESLTEQLSFLPLTDKERDMAVFIIGTLDGDGYLRKYNQTISDELLFSQNIDASVDEIEIVVNKIQSLEPAGVAARDLRECLLLQLRRSDEDRESVKRAEFLLEKYYDNIVNKRYETILAKTGMSRDELRDAVEEIVALNPKPSNGFADEGVDTSQSVTPDFFVNYNPGEDDFEIILYGEDPSKLRISRSYLKMAEELKRGENPSSREAIEFISKKIRSAEWFISSVKQRQDTLKKTMRAIVNRQRLFFIDGNHDNLRPMVLKDIAEDTGLDVSTVWRVVDSKYVETTFGIYHLKEFFSGGYTTSDGEEVTSKNIKNIIKSLVDAENPSSPLTDQQLVDFLKEKGYDIARRTIAKYREQLGLPVARLRKKL